MNITCTTCDEVYFSKEQWENHTCLESGSQYHHCFGCHKTFLNLWAIDQHYCEVMSFPRFEPWCYQCYKHPDVMLFKEMGCNRCYKLYDNRVEWATHECEEKWPPNTDHCMGCHGEILHGTEYMEHIKSCRPDIIVDRDTERDCICCVQGWSEYKDVEILEKVLTKFKGDIIDILIKFPDLLESVISSMDNIMTFNREQLYYMQEETGVPPAEIVYGELCKKKIGDFITFENTLAMCESDDAPRALADKLYAEYVSHPRGCSTLLLL